MVIGIEPAGRSPAKLTPQTMQYLMQLRRWATTNGLLNRHRPIRVDDLCKMNVLCAKGINDGVHRESDYDRVNASGNFRAGRIDIGVGMTTSPAKELPTLMAGLVDWINAQETTRVGERAPELAAEVYLRLIVIHPFNDANGRTARLLINLLLTRHRKRPVDLDLIDWHRIDVYDFAPQDVQYMAHLIREAQIGRSTVGIGRYSRRPITLPPLIEDALKLTTISGEAFLDWLNGFVEASPPILSNVFKMFKKLLLLLTNSLR